MTQTTLPPTPLQRSARYGLYMGLYLSAIFVMQVFMQSYPQLGLLATIATFAYPLVIYRQMRLSQVRSKYKLNYGELFSQGVLTTLFGAIVSCLVALLYIRFVQPTYVDDIFDQAIISYTQAGIPADDPAMQQLTAIRQYGQLPSGSEMCVLMSSLIVMFGSVISLVLAALAVRGPRRRNISQSNQSYL